MSAAMDERLERDVDRHRREIAQAFAEARARLLPPVPEPIYDPHMNITDPVLFARVAYSAYAPMNRRMEASAYPPGFADNWLGRALDAFL